jgi:hypothetical protein
MAYGLEIRSEGNVIVFNEVDNFTRVSQQVAYDLPSGGSVTINQIEVGNTSKYKILVIPLVSTNISDNIYAPTVTRSTNSFTLKNTNGGTSRAVGSVIILREA